MKIQKNTIVTLENGKRFLILERISYMYRDYYMTWEVDKADNLLQNAKTVLWKVLDEDLDDDLEEEEIYLEVIRNRSLENLLWEIFSVMEDNSVFL